MSGCTDGRMNRNYLSVIQQHCEDAYIATMVIFSVPDSKLVSTASEPSVMEETLFDLEMRQCTTKGRKRASSDKEDVDCTKTEYFMQ